MINNFERGPYLPGEDGTRSLFQDHKDCAELTGIIVTVREDYEIENH
ncbi:hypothetical protein D1AOALGA4SA_11726 [Olavius algarvensis Delta 1 endosymbiont]|nr:hypothetical protein D1AOALGA4SA_11726 [Olavius algarvensis Delta 1 endosymbiont]